MRRGKGEQRNGREWMREAEKKTKGRQGGRVGEKERRKRRIRSQGGWRSGREEGKKGK